VASFDEFVNSLNPFGSSPRAGVSLFPSARNQPSGQMSSLQSRPDMASAARNLLANAITSKLDPFGSSHALTGLPAQQLIPLADMADRSFGAPGASMGMGMPKRSPLGYDTTSDSAHGGDQQTPTM
jgi:hypothetical protein